MDRSLVGYSPWGHREWDRIEHATLTHSGGARLVPPPAAGVVHVRD